MIWREMPLKKLHTVITAYTTAKNTLMTVKAMFSAVQNPPIQITAERQQATPMIFSAE